VPSEVASPLAGMRVVDLCRLLPGDFATWVLADLGAEVIKVEDTQGGDYMRWTPPLVGHSGAMYQALNRGKRSLCLDLKQDVGREVLLRLIDTADALVEGFRPGVMERLGLGAAALRERNPHLVYCAITGYGQDGPYSQRAGHDLDYNSLAGLQGVTGTSEGELAVPGFQVADLAGGGMGGALAVVSALLARERDPERRGSFCDVSMFDGVAAIIAPHVLSRLAGGGAAGRAGGDGLPGRMALNGGFPCYRLYRSADDRWMALAALEPKFWRAFCELVEQPDLLDRQFDFDAVPVVQEVIGGRTRAAWLEAVEGRDVCLEPVNSLAEAVEDPQFKARGLLIDAGELPQPAPLVRLESRHHADTRVAAQGEDSVAILTELGYGPAEVERLREARAIVATEAPAPFMA
jgi:alpha-methylacyl-CoA racemase